MGLGLLEGGGGKRAGGIFDRASQVSLGTSRPTFVAIYLVLSSSF